MHPWIDAHAIVDLGSLTHSLAASFVDYVNDSAGGVYQLLEARSSNGFELIVGVIQTERPQRPVTDIKREETIAILFFHEDFPPLVLALRDDFPDTPHQSRMPMGMPFGICVDDRPWAEAKTTYTAAELGYRTLQWFRKASRGELHDAAQPLEPFFSLQSGYELIMPRSAWSGTADEPVELSGYPAHAGREKILTLLPPDGKRQGLAITVLAYDLAAETMSRMRQSPRTLADLAAELLPRGVDLVEDLKKRINGWYSDDQRRDAIFRSRPCVLLRMPLINPVTGKVEGVDVVGFIPAEQMIGDIGVCLGTFIKGEDEATGYHPRFVHGEVKLADCEVVGCLVHSAFDTILARLVSGRATALTGKVLVIGAGAIGSSVAESLVREGAFDEWTVLDDDTLLPHNLARHTLTSAQVSSPKVDALGRRLKSIRPDMIVNGCDENFLSKMSEAATVEINSANVIIDASASVAVARRLSDLQSPARRSSIFFNPTGTAAVMLVEDSERRFDLRFLEAIYHRTIQTEPALAEHLVDGKTIRYTGACRMLTSRIPASRVQVLSGLVAGGLSSALADPHATVKIWTLDAEGSVTTITSAVDGTIDHALDWTVRMPGSLSRELVDIRSSRLPNETGGALLGIVDAAAKRIDLVAALPAPNDSKEAPTEFIRGTVGLRQVVEKAVERSASQVRYVGEWHSHPRGSSSQPSGIDMQQLAWLSTTMAADGMPGVMFIVGENDARHLIGTIENG
ncbi:MAG: uncharacterized protein JWR51_4600 [Devosia sp.]|uniref:ThiF family adenylyltransferase n=1 Tax=Devosia sp. TaxID=1871048 RepID=UPI00262C62D5|nr:ThiF family adenylyltransferase [Devosia sp.]MDB5531497.1 uncharacterized protein [Devosia sp.]